MGNRITAVQSPPSLSAKIPNMTQHHKNRLVIGGVLLIILILAAYFRLVNVHGNPGWFTDEGTHIEVARALLDGRIQYLAIKDSTLLFSRLPLFEYLLAEVGRLFGLNITTLRLLTGSLGVFSVGLLALVVWRMTKERWLAVTAAFILAIFPAAIVYGRFGFSYNLLTPLLLLVWLGLWEYDQTRSNKWLALAAICLGLGTISDLWMIGYLPVFVLIVLFSSNWQLFETRFIKPRSRLNWHTLAWSLPLALLPFTIYVVHSLITAPDAFLFDANFVRARLSLSLGAQIQSLATNLTVLLSQDGWIALGFIGFLALPRKEQRRFLLLFILLPVIILGRSTALHGLGFHYFIPFLPFIALGIAALLWRGVPILADALPFIPQKTTAKPFAIGIVCIPLFTTIWLLNGQVNGRYQTAIDPFLIDPQDAETVAAFINHELGEDDLVIATPTLTWLLHMKSADFQMSVAAAGIDTPHLPADIPPERYAFNPDYHLAKMVVVDNWWYTWGQFNIPGLTQMLTDVTTWPLVFSSGDMKVYQNPALSNQS
ncbi:MAG: phospholipid carrier-dependent glycosyltransferase [Candidatus Promineifilaceae bacterium]